jgi:HEAT repeat protein
LADPNASPVAKVLVAVCLTPIANEDALRGEAKRILALTEPGNEATTRACATQLLWHYTGEEYDVAVKKLAEDPERRVKLAALTVLGGRQDDNAVNQLVLMWGEAATSVDEKNQIATTIAGQPLNPKRVNILGEAAADTRLHPDVRLQSVMVLSMVGAEKEIELLKKCAEGDQDANVKQAAQQAIEAIKARLAGAVDAAAGGASPISITTSPVPADGAAPAPTDGAAPAPGQTEGQQPQQIKISF